ncbi:hypothetical protein GOP47_0000688 [Adiantum capillus-veneris]|uniref:Large ribosomal subunit protein uL15/eL18 domain-containing protein n=1 Tax=Adiantum capillus-veneris TaxID=13818 RepID=A0A9D4ZQR9_ADICA|nr:hypothetical protein GOP47_0000688 [Adiantum capillus-veneris]
MGIDLPAGGCNKKTKCTAPKSDNVYLNLIVNLYRFLAASIFISSHTLLHEGEGGRGVIVVTVTNDVSVYGVLALKAAALRFTQTAPSRILKGGGECFTFDQLALKVPSGSNTVLLRGPKNACEAVKHFGRARRGYRV